MPRIWETAGYKLNIQTFVCDGFYRACRLAYAVKALRAESETQS
jgi:hypothetical protein